MAQASTPQDRPGTKIARLDIKLDISIRDDEEFDELFVAAQTSASEAARRYFGQGYAVSIRAREGSLLVVVTVLGTIGATILGTQQFLVAYPQMKSGLQDLVQDTTRFATKFRDRFLKRAGAQPNDLQTFEAKSLAPQRLLTLAAKLEQIAEHRRRHGDTEEGKRLALEVERELIHLRPLLSNSDKEALLTKLQETKLPELPYYGSVLLSLPESSAKHAPEREHELFIRDERNLPVKKRRRRRSKTKTIYL